MTPRLIFGDRQVQAKLSVISIDRYMHNIEKRIEELPPDVKQLFDSLYLENLYLAYTIGGYDLLNQVANAEH